MKHHRGMHIAPFIAVVLLASCAASPREASVVSVTDGDTIRVRTVEGKEERVRIIGIDTPETVDPRRPVQCFGEEASGRMKELVMGRKITLLRKPDEDRDNYGRLLRYVEVEGRDIGALMIGEGFAHSYKRFPHPRLEDYNRLEKEAREGERGLWGEACDE